MRIHETVRDVNENDASPPKDPPFARQLKESAAKGFDAIQGGLSAAGRTLARAASVMRERLLAQQITVYPTFGFRDPLDAKQWQVPIRVWVHDNRDTPFVEAAIERWAVRYFEEDMQRPLDAAEKARLAQCLAPFIADDKQNEAVEVSFGDDPTATFPLRQRTSLNGVIEEIVTVSAEMVDRLRAENRSGTPWCEITARTGDGHGAGTGAVRFLEPDGVSVVSDIDDTIRITHVPAGKKTVLRNTFLREFRAAEGMRERYCALAVQAGPDADVCFHYVSGGPWQLFARLHEFFIDEQQFPRGTFHMKNLRKNLLEPGALQTITNFAIGGDLATLDQKIRQITALMIHFPRRKFILIGDSGEKDPEVYRAIRKLFPKQVIRVLIRDVLSDRLAGMELITGGDVPVLFDTTELEREMEQLVHAAREVATQTEKL